MTQSFTLPDLGEGIQEGEIRAILVVVGDKVEEDHPILEVETDKAAVEIPSPFSGYVSEIRVEVGDIVNVGDVLIRTCSRFAGYSDGAFPVEIFGKGPHHGRRRRCDKDHC